MRILLVEDDRKVASFIRRGLVAEGFSVDVAAEGRDGFHLATHEPYDVIVLDLMLPHVEGLEILRGVRSHGIDTPVMILTAKDDVDDRVRGLNQGADDYLVKPFAFAELVARIQALLRRRTPAQQGTALQVADLRLDLAKRQVVRAGRSIELTPPGILPPRVPHAQRRAGRHAGHDQRARVGPTLRQLQQRHRRLRPLPAQESR